MQICKASECPLKEKDRYSTNDMYQPPLVSWIWHAYPYSALASHAWVEVLHEADPFGDEHHGMWLVYAPGSGIFQRQPVELSRSGIFLQNARQPGIVLSRCLQEVANTGD